MKLYYLNDERREMTVRILDARYDPTTGQGDVYVKLASCEGRLLDVQIPAGHVPYVKKWPNMVMISYIDPAVLTQSDEQPPQAEDAPEDYALHIFDRKE
jgi:hypothetical protein